MSILLIDTDVVSFIFKQDSRAENYTTLLQDNQLALSFMTVAELFQWLQFVIGVNLVLGNLSKLSPTT
ncbi:MAG: hypothetical protein SFY66_28550 [Oculatellaceae cyanobacterium bins.114]|nr:hypothetical protein [Oculatellaceae cyanobacterium bins.114]